MENAIIAIKTLAARQKSLLTQVHLCKQQNSRCSTEVALQEIGWNGLTST